MTTVKNFTIEEKNKLKQLIREGNTILTEVDDLQGGLKDTVAALAEELQIKPAILTKAIKVAHKGDFDKHNDDHNLLEDILIATGRTT